MAHRCCRMTTKLVLFSCSPLHLLYRLLCVFSSKSFICTTGLGASPASPPDDAYPPYSSNAVPSCRRSTASAYPCGLQHRILTLQYYKCLKRCSGARSPRRKTSCFMWVTTATTAMITIAAGVLSFLFLLRIPSR